jgi:hypothetical protein
MKHRFFRDKNKKELARSVDNHKRQKNYDFTYMVDIVKLPYKEEMCCIEVDDEDGFSSWLITKEPMNTAYLIVSNHKYPTEKVTKKAPTGEDYRELVEGYPIFDKEIYIPTDYTLEKEYIIGEKDFEPHKIGNMDSIHFDKLEPGDFRIYELKRN